jgi:hypothetical protein
MAFLVFQFYLLKAATLYKKKTNWHLLKNNHLRSGHTLYYSNQFSSCNFFTLTFALHLKIIRREEIEGEQKAHRNFTFAFRINHCKH